MKPNISEDGGYMRSVAATQRRHLRALARHVNRASVAQRASADHIGQLRAVARQMRDKRQKFAHQLKDFLAAGAPPNSPAAMALTTSIEELDQQIADSNAEILEVEERCRCLVAVSAPLRDQLLTWMHSLRVDASEIGLGGLGTAGDAAQVHIVDVNHIAARGSAEGGAK